MQLLHLRQAGLALRQKPGATITPATGRVSTSASPAAKLGSISGSVSTTAKPGAAVTSGVTAPVPVLNRPPGAKASPAAAGPPSDTEAIEEALTTSTGPQPTGSGAHKLVPRATTTSTPVAAGVKGAGLSGGNVPQAAAGVLAAPAPTTFNKNLIINLVIIVVLIIACLIAWDFVQEKQAESERSARDRALANAIKDDDNKKVPSGNSHSSRVTGNDKKKPNGPRVAIDIKVEDDGKTNLDHEVKTIDLAEKERTTHEEARKQLEAEQLNLLNGIVNIDKLPNNTITRGGSFYLYINQKMTWHEADAFCNTYGGQVATCSQLADASFPQETL